jgi:hypothetical protein
MSVSPRRQADDDLDGVTPVLPAASLAARTIGNTAFR